MLVMLNENELNFPQHVYEIKKCNLQNYSYQEEDLIYKYIFYTIKSNIKIYM